MTEREYLDLHYLFFTHGFYWNGTNRRVQEWGEKKGVASRSEKQRHRERERERERASLTLITRSTKKLVLLGPFFWRFLKQIKHKENKWVQSLWAEKVEDSTTRLSLENSEWERLWGGGWTLASGDDSAPLFEDKERERERNSKSKCEQTGREIAAARFLSYSFFRGLYLLVFFFNASFKF